MEFLAQWNKAATTSVGLFWMAFWAFGLGYVISSMIQVFVTKERMQRSMGKAGAKDVSLATFFGFLSSSCSFAALATTRALFAKGAGFVPSLAFLLASTNLVIELGIVIAVFLTWQFVVAEYVGGVLLILLMWLTVKVTNPKQLIKKRREHARQKTAHDEYGEIPNWKKLIRSKEGWTRVAKRYVMEWQMVWKDVTIGFTVAGAIAAFVPESFFRALFLGTGTPDQSFWQLVLQSLVGPVAAFFTFIGSMGNIPLAAVLFSHGVSFAGIMAFIFSDLVVFPVLRIQAEYYGWKMSFYILGVFLVVLVATALIMHIGFDLLDLLPDPSQAQSVTERQFFKVDYKFFLNLFFVTLTVIAAILKSRQSDDHNQPGKKNLSDKLLTILAIMAFTWIAGGLLAGSFSL